jgi:hypothetical protein
LSSKSGKSVKVSRSPKPPTPPCPSRRSSRWVVRFGLVFRSSTICLCCFWGTSGMIET